LPFVRRAWAGSDSGRIGYFGSGIGQRRTNTLDTLDSDRVRMLSAVAVGGPSASLGISVGHDTATADSRAIR